MDAVAKLAPRMGPLTVNHLGQLPSVTISFNLKPGVALGDAVNQIEEIWTHGSSCQHQHQLSGNCPSLPIVSPEVLASSC